MTLTCHGHERELCHISDLSLSVLETLLCWSHRAVQSAQPCALGFYAAVGSIECTVCPSGSFCPFECAPLAALVIFFESTYIHLILSCDYFS
jgi:hypothetical protein